MDTGKKNNCFAFNKNQQRLIIILIFPNIGFSITSKVITHDMFNILLNVYLGRSKATKTRISLF